jgi:hypothetical protein
MHFQILQKDIAPTYKLEEQVKVPKRKSRQLKSTQVYAQDLIITDQDVTKINNVLLSKTRRKLLKNPILTVHEIVPERQQVQKLVLTAAKRAVNAPVTIPRIVIEEEEEVPIATRRYPPMKCAVLTMEQLIQKERPKIGTPKPLPPKTWTVI